MNMRIDAHHHFWKYDPVEYDWIDDRMAAIRRDFGLAELRAAAREARVDGVVSVQARQTLEETRWLLEIAAGDDLIRGVVGWVPLVSPRVSDDLDRFAANRKLRGVRHVLQAEPDDFFRRDDFNSGIRGLKPRGLAYDILVIERHAETCTCYNVLGIFGNERRRVVTGTVWNLQDFSSTES